METVRVALLFSTSGVMEQTEKPLMLFGRYCFDLLKPLFEARGLTLEVEEADYGSDFRTLLEKIRELERRACRYFFGPYTTLHRRPARKVMTPLSLMFYPVQYEGFDDEGATWFFGGTPNQQLIPVLDWFKNLVYGAKVPVYFIGSDYAYPKMVLAILSDPAVNNRLELIEWRLLPLDDARSIADFVQFLRASEPGLVVNAINGNGNRALFEEIQKSKSTCTWPADMRVVSLSLSDVELLQYSPAAREGSTGSYLAANCFDSQIAKSPDSKLCRVRSGFQEFLRKIASQRGPMIPPLLSDAMVNLYSAIDFWSGAFLGNTRSAPPSPVDVAAFLRRSDVSLQGPIGPLQFRGADKHGEKRFFLAELNNGRVKNIVQPFDRLYEALPLLDSNVPSDSLIFALAKEIADEEPDPQPVSSGEFHQKLAVGEVRYKPDPGHLFNIPCLGFQSHTLSEIYDAAQNGISNGPAKQEWLKHWDGLVIAIEQLNCVDPDIRSAIGAFRRNGAAGAGQLASATCKLRAIYTRCIPQDRSKRRLYLFDALDIAMTNRASIEIDSRPVKDSCRLADEMARLKALNFNWDGSKIDDATVAEALLAFNEVASKHRVSAYENGAQYQIELNLPLRSEDQPTLDKVVLPEENSRGNLASLIRRIRLLEPYLAAVVPLPVKIARSSEFQPFEPADRFALAAPVYVFQVQYRPTGIGKQVESKARMTITLRMRWE